MQLTYFGANSWLLEFEQLHILIDPWLVGRLCFGGQRWFFEGTHTLPTTIPDRIDLVLLAQGLPDHAHPPTLKKLDRQLPVVASPSAAKVVQGLGYSTVTVLSPGQTHRVADAVEIRATAGAPVPQTENGYLITGLQTGKKLYYEPHGFSDRTLPTYAPIDVVIAPVVDLTLPLAGAFVKGNQTTIQLLQALQARYVLPTTAGEGIEYAGIIDRLLSVKGSPEHFRQQLQAANLQTELVEAKPQQAIALTL
ncbi:MAG: MBL fold metallo-hydrolase [Synechococcales cyanobacterium CRU_2_2]|nr:MBL fold metallo-hydrolase [Synechococcales cyanobacterium CRU_2_2]